MKKNISVILNVILFVLLISCWFKIQSLEERMQNMQNNLTDRLWDIDNAVNNITYNIKKELEEEASLLSNSSWAFGDMNIENRTVSVRCEVVPKEYLPGETVTELICNDTRYPMELINGTYVAELNASLFEETSIPSVTFTEGARVRTEQLNWYLNPRYDFIAQVYADFSGKASGGKEYSSAYPEEEVFLRSYDGEVNVNVEQKEAQGGMISIRLVETIDGKEITSRELPLDKGVAITDEGLKEDAGAEQAISGIPGYYYFVLKHSVEIPFGSVYDMYVEVEDSYGLYHRLPVQHENVDENGQPVDDGWIIYSGYEESIYDAEGNQLFVMDEELYR